MNKRDVLHIVSIAFGIYFLMMFLYSLSGLGIVLCMKDTEYYSRASQIIWTSLNVFFLFCLTFLFLIRNRYVVDLLLPKQTIAEQNGEKNISISGKLSFWIKLIGIYYFVTSFSKVIANLPGISAIRAEYVSNTYWWNQTGTYLIALIVSLILIFKSQRIEQLINKSTNNKSLSSSSNPKEDEEWVCTECDAVVPADAKSCPRCGSDVREIEEDPPDIKTHNPQQN